MMLLKYTFQYCDCSSETADPNHLNKGFRTAKVEFNMLRMVKLVNIMCMGGWVIVSDFGDIASTELASLFLGPFPLLIGAILFEVHLPFVPPYHCSLQTSC